MLNIAICDDVQSDRMQIESFINDFCSRENFRTNRIIFEDGESLVRYYMEGNPRFDIVFLDIYMTGLNGLKSAEQVRKFDSECKIIFTTSSTEHALISFSVFPFNYLVKPITKKVFESVFNRALEKINNEIQKNLSIKIGSKIFSLPYKDIMFIESNAKVVNVHMATSNPFSYISKLDDLESQINDKRFIRCHKSFLVNMDYISCVENYTFKLINNTQTPITQRHYVSIKKAFYDYLLDKANLKNDLKKVD